jgi:hypothetical protein
MMEVTLPIMLGAAVDTEIAKSSKPGRTRREYVLDAVSDKLAHDRGYRERSAKRRAESESGGETG